MQTGARRGNIQLFGHGHTLTLRVLYMTMQPLTVFGVKSSSLCLHFGSTTLSLFPRKRARISSALPVIHLFKPMHPPISER